MGSLAGRGTSLVQLNPYISGACTLNLDISDLHWILEIVEIPLEILQKQDGRTRLSSNGVGGKAHLLCTQRECGERQLLHFSDPTSVPGRQVHTVLQQV